VVPVLLIANMFLGIYYNLSVWYKLSDQTNKGAMISLIGAGITIAANFILVPIMGYTGAAWATLICYVSMTLICYVMGMKYYPIPYHTIKLMGYIIFAIVIYAAAVLIKENTASLTTQFILNALLMIIFAGVVFVAERRYRRVLK
jgi:O-antigen/teichoic acid export membrane protein